MAVSEKKVFTFNWKIKNFSLCQQKGTNYVCSPTFGVDFLNKSEWKLLVFPRRLSEGTLGETVGCFLWRMKARDYEEDINIGFSLSVPSLMGQDIVKTVDSQVFKTSADWGYPTIATREEILNSANGYLPDDTLILTCQMWEVDEDDKLMIKDNGVSDIGIEDSGILKQVCTAVSRDEKLNFRNQFSSSQCSAVTVVRVGRKSVLWPIRRFSELLPSTKLTIPIVTALKADPSFFLTVWLSRENVADRCIQIEIQRKEADSKKQCFVKCKISIFNTLKRETYLKEDEHFFDSNKESNIWKFPDFVNINELINEKNENFSQDIVYLRCEFAFSLSGDVYHIQQTDFVPVSSQIPFPNPVHFNSMGPVFQDMRRDGKLTDVILCVENREIKAHKLILSAHSSVFNAMFENDMKEKQNGIVDITDIDAATLDRMLDFMYTNDLKIDEHTDAMKLYSVADKYEILSLMSSCSCFLKSSLTVSNVCSVLILAAMHKDHDLMDGVRNFIQMHASEIFHTKAWEDLMQSNSKLASDIMLKVLTN